MGRRSGTFKFIGDCFYQDITCLLIDLFQSCTGHVLCSILLNSADLLRVDLQGVQVLLPHLITALETVLPRNDIQIGLENNDLCDLEACLVYKYC